MLTEGMLSSFCLELVEFGLAVGTWITLAVLGNAGREDAGSGLVTNLDRSRLGVLVGTVTVVVEVVVVVVVVVLVVVVVVVAVVVVVVVVDVVVVLVVLGTFSTFASPASFFSGK